MREREGIRGGEGGEKVKTRGKKLNHIIGQYTLRLWPISFSFGLLIHSVPEERILTNTVERRDFVRCFIIIKALKCAITDHVAMENQVIGWEDTEILERDSNLNNRRLKSGRPFGFANAARTP